MRDLLSQLIVPKATADGEPKTSTASDLDHLLARGNDLEDKGEYGSALECYASAARIAPASARAHLNIGNALQKLQRVDEAAASFRAAIQIAPDYAPARFNLGSLLAARGEYEAAEAELSEAMRIAPQMIEAAVVVSAVMEATGRIVEAERVLREALDLRPDYALAALNLGQLLLRQDRFHDAVPFFERSAVIAPDALSWMLSSINNRGDLDPGEIHRRLVSAGEAIVRVSAPSFTAWSNDPDPDKRIRVGYVSGDFRLHPVGLFMKPVLFHHDRGAFDIHCFYNSAEIDSATEVLRQLAPSWTPISHLSNDQVAELFRREKIDVLVDLSGHTNLNRMRTFARHPAPVQVTWLGYLNTTGLSTMDYRICDHYTDPGGVADPLHTENLIRMPDSQWCYDPSFAPAHYTRAIRPSERILFGSLNSSLKITDESLKLWCRILHDVPLANLLVIDVAEKDRQLLLNRFERHGIGSSRLFIQERQSLDLYYRTAGDVDVALDTFPYNGATTTLDTLWMGTPVVALPGDRGVSRSSYSILNSIPLPELIAQTQEEYVEINVRLAGDDAWRNHLRASLRARLAASPMMDAPRFVAALEANYRRMWQTWCEVQASAP